MNSEIADVVGILAVTQGVGFAVLALALSTPLPIVALVVALPITLLVTYELDGTGADDEAADPHAEVEA